MLDLNAEIILHCCGVSWGQSMSAFCFGFFIDFLKFRIYFSLICSLSCRILNQRMRRNLMIMLGWKKEKLIAFRICFPFQSYPFCSISWPFHTMRTPKSWKYGTGFLSIVKNLSANFFRSLRRLFQTSSKLLWVITFWVTAIVSSKFMTACHQPPGTKTVSPGCWINSIIPNLYLP